ncbi:MaoC/PaaZ C-terminal domain-containing protein [Thalassotalea mangrovi]|uniref:MaoC-like domain-containing protein n=1 Tax=Thalassotalea mangrovi TaxID=2572245 RepID=A0A4U1B475_9GAMM|nr:MaoC/PaaZ C-terminal domain-containing protein [Thalassotalea mangrovi]TKB45063.1 hypothetical protein E8M12_09510 [Thalassotalea mangrovi]
MLTYLKILTKKNLSADAITNFQCQFRNCQVDLKNQQSFRNVMHLSHDQPLPISYEFITAFPYILKVSADKRFAYSALGLVHLSSEFQCFQELDRTAEFDLNIDVIQDIEHAKGKAVKMVIEFYQDNKLCVRNTNLMLKKSKHLGEQRPQQAPKMFQQEYFLLLNHKLARRYASISGDYNPIHMYDFTARLFGFDHAIIHGMYLAHRLLLDKKVETDHCRISFKKPCKLPAKVGVCRQEQQLYAFSNGDQLHMEIELLSTDEA